MFSLSEVIQLCAIVFAAATTIALTRKDLKFLKGRIEYWFGSGNATGKDDPEQEGKGIIKLKMYIQKELSNMDERICERCAQNEERIKQIERV